MPPLPLAAVVIIYCCQEPVSPTLVVTLSGGQSHMHGLVLIPLCCGAGGHTSHRLLGIKVMSDHHAVDLVHDLIFT